MTWSVQGKKKQISNIFQVKTAKEHQQKIEKDITTRTIEADDSKFRWWSEFLSTVANNAKLEQQMMDRIQNELRNYPNPAIEKYAAAKFFYF